MPHPWPFCQPAAPPSTGQRCRSAWAPGQLRREAARCLVGAGPPQWCLVGASLVPARRNGASPQSWAARACGEPVGLLRWRGRAAARMLTNTDVDQAHHVLFPPGSDSAAPLGAASLHPGLCAAPSLALGVCARPAGGLWYCFSSVGTHTPFRRGAPTGPSAANA
jgi:hypothetical protein